MNTYNKPLIEAIEDPNSLTMLRALQYKLAATIDSTKSARDIAALSRQLREVTERIAELEALNEKDDIGVILENRKAAGLPGAVRNEKRQAI